jgi:hypothetical protein
MDRVGGRCVEDEGRSRDKRGVESYMGRGYRRRGGVEKRRRRVGNILREGICWRKRGGGYIFIRSWSVVYQCMQFNGHSV